MTYDFDTQFRKGQDGEHELDSFFAGIYSIRKATRDQERCGIDRIFITPDGRQVPVQYKTDSASDRTGNFFIETVSGDEIGQPGWVFTCTAERIVFYQPGHGAAYVVDPVAIRQHVRANRTAYQVRAIDNGRYATYGLLIPAKVIYELAIAQYDLLAGAAA